MREATVEARLTRVVKALGGLAMKFTSPGHDGVPDRIVLMPGGHIWFVELKQTHGRLTPLQIDTHNRLRALGCDVRTLYGRDYVDGFIEEIRKYAVQALPVSEDG